MARFVALLVLVVLGCGPGTPSTQADACNEYANAWCARAKACKALLTQTESQCQASYAMTCCAMVDSCAAPVTDQVRFAACYDALHALSCVDVESAVVPTPCLR